MLVACEAHEGELEACERGPCSRGRVILQLDSVRRALDSANALLSSPAAKRAVADLPQVTGALKHAIASVERDVTALTRTGGDVLGRTDVSLPGLLTVHGAEPVRDEGSVPHLHWGDAERRQRRAGRTQLQVPLAHATPQAVAHATSAALTLLADKLPASAPCTPL